ncbi:MAG TPA: DUF3617 family protein [Burkholderiaceae bacterium]|nr:DUF3617 family protein [Burkholderiaceae bacterium]
MASMRLQAHALLASVLTSVIASAAAQPFAPRLYAVATETGLPHLEENLRYATTRSRLCLGRPQLATAFPILQHEALKGCTLDHERSSGASLSLHLTCEGGSQTTGAAEWHVDELGIHGTLDVKLGGKNMTFYQRINGRPVGDCAPGD